MQSDRTQYQVGGEGTHYRSPVDTQQPIEIGTAVQKTEFVFQDDDSAPDLNQDSFYCEWIERCTSSANDYAAATTTKDFRARRYLQVIAECVHDERFNLPYFATFSGHKSSKSDIKNPYRFLMKIVDSGRDRKVISKQAQALIYALSKCDNDPARLEEFFTECSIKECLRRKSSEKKAGKIKRIAQNDRLTISDVPSGLSGLVTITIKIENEIASFVCLVGNDELPETKAVPYIPSYQENKNFLGNV